MYSYREVVLQKKVGLGLSVALDGSSAISGKAALSNLQVSLQKNELTSANEGSLGFVPYMLFLFSLSLSQRL